MGFLDGHSKPMVPILDKPLISYAIDSMLFCGVSTIYVVFSDFSKDIVTLQNYYKGDQLIFLHEENVTGSLASFSFAESKLEVPFVMMDADIILQLAMWKQALDQYVYQGEDMAIAAVTAPSFPNPKTLHIRDSRPVGFYGKGYTGSNTKHDVFCQGGMIYLWFRSPGSELMEFRQQNKYKLSCFLDFYIKTHPVGLLTIPDVWDVDTPDDIRNSTKILRSNLFQNGGDKSNVSSHI